MVIAYLLGQYPTISHSFVYREIAALQRQSVPVYVYGLSRTQESDHQILLPQQIEWVPTAHSVLRSDSIAASVAEQWCENGGRKKDLRRARWLARTWRRLGVSCVHTHFLGFEAAIAAVACRIANIPLVVTVHARGIFVPGSLTSLTVQQASSLIAISHHTANVIMAKTGRHSTVLPVPIARAEVSPSSDKPLHVLSVGRPVPKKGFSTLREALTNLDIPYRWTVAGAQEEELGGEMSGLQAMGPVSFERIEEVYRNGVDLFALACCEAPDGDVDGVPVAMMEAMARGVAVVSTDVGSISELIEHGETGILVPPEDPSALCRAIARLAKDDVLRHRLGQNARASVQKNRAVEQHTNALLNHFLDVIGAQTDIDSN